MQYWDNTHETLDDTRAFVAATMKAPQATSCDFILEREGRAIGKAGMWEMPEIGFILHPDHWRQGLMREALSVVIPHLFDSYPMRAMTADVDPDNAGSLALLQTLGFQQTGTAKNTIEIGGRWCDSVYLSLKRP